MYYVIQTDFTADGKYISSEDINKFTTLEEAAAAVKRLYEPCHTADFCYFHNDGSYCKYHVACG